jgi:hypothetical protein
MNFNESLTPYHEKLLKERLNLINEIRKINDDSSLSVKELEEKMYMLDKRMEEIENDLYEIEINM